MNPFKFPLFVIQYGGLKSFASGPRADWSADPKDWLVFTTYRAAEEFREKYVWESQAHVTEIEASVEIKESN
jgi:hypothetical protein